MKLTPAEKESSWRLLFDIALSHGESLLCQRLTYNGFRVFAESAALIGASTGVFPALLEELWHRHSEPWSRVVEKLASQRVTHGLPLGQSSAANVAAFHEAAREHGVVNFDGFADMMNVISVRCFQTHQCSALVRGESQQTLREAIALSAETRVRLVECVSYTAAEYLKEFVHKNTVHRQTVIRLDPQLNTWTPHVRALVTHLVGSLHATLLLPLFHRFAPTGQMNRTEYANFVHTILPPLNAIEEVSALAIFDYREFSHPNVYAKPLEDILARPADGGVAGASTDTTPGREPPALSGPEIAKAVAMRTIGLDAFVDAVLMLGVVVYADERLCPRHRCITAKIWSVLDEYLCRAVPSAVMASDPLFTPSHASVTPLLSLVYPARLPIDRLSVVLLGGLNLTVATEDGPAAAATTAAASDPPRVVSAASTSSSAPAEDATAPHDSLASSGIGASGAIKRDVDAAASSTASLSVAGTGAAAVLLPVSVAEAASALFNTAFEKARYTTADTPVYGQLRSHTYVNEEEATSEMLCPNLAALHLPSTFWNTTTFRSRVSFVPASGSADAGALLFTPFRRVTVSLRHEDGVRVYASAELVLETVPTRQPLSQTVLKALEAAFHAHRDGAHGDDDDVEDPRGLPATISTRAFVDICRQLHLVSAATASLLCQTAIQAYWTLTQDSRSGADGEASGMAASQSPHATSTVLPTSLSFSQFMCCIAHVCMKQSNVVSAANLDILQYLSVALSSTSSPPPAADIDPAGAAMRSAALPHNGLREVPYQQAITLRRRAAAEGTERRTELLVALRDMRSLEATAQHAPQQGSAAQSLAVSDAVLAQELADVTPTTPMLPAFPFMSSAGAVSASVGSPDNGALTPLYAPGWTRSDAINALFGKMQSDFLRQEVVIKYP